MRKLASIRVIQEIKEIPGADNIQCAVVDAWEVVIKRGEYSVGDKVIYCEIDSWIPTEIAPFLSKGKEPKEYNGVKGERLRTAKLRGQLSQGLVLPMHVMNAENYKDRSDRGLDSCWVKQVGNKFIGANDKEGSDVSQYLGIQKWEPPVSASLSGDAKGLFPSEIPKTDQERIQNLKKEYETLKEDTWQVTEKLHGSSCTFYLDENNEFRVCSRNLELKESETNAYWKAANSIGIKQKMQEAKLQGYAIQGELIGQGINGNQYNVGLEFYVFDIYCAHSKEYLNPSVVKATADTLGLKHCPVIHESYKIKPETEIQDLLTFAEGMSVLNGSNREGLVFKSQSNSNSFKVISNSWLLKNE